MQLELTFTLPSRAADSEGHGVKVSWALVSGSSPESEEREVCHLAKLENLENIFFRWHIQVEYKNYFCD